MKKYITDEHTGLKYKLIGMPKKCFFDWQNSLPMQKVSLKNERLSVQ